MFTINCPRCGRFSCEHNGFDLHCPNCLYHESSDQIKAIASATPTDCEDLDCCETFETETLGEYIEQIPSDTWKWCLSLGDERILRMTEYIQNDDPSLPQNREVPPYELVAFPDEERGTSWTKHGTAWPTKDGKRLRIRIFMDRPLPENGKLLLVESIRAAPRTRSEDVPF